MGKTELKSKEAKMKAAMAGGAKRGKKKWSKGKMKEKLQNLVLFDQATHDKLFDQVPKMKVITTAAVSEKLKINGSLARRALKELMAKGLIKQVSYHKDLAIYTRATHTAA